MHFGLTESTIRKICAVFLKHPEIEKALIYGSRAKNNFRHSSDIDLTLVGGKELNPDLLFKILGELDDLLLPYTIDLSILHKIENQDLIDHIARVGKVFYQQAESR
ncbi:MAG: nucleotidyltransferase domain-containing protein [Deferribacteres bacterium]|nr:nucleotidyltransferase domain-containing protein [candidate division KSB1 bacterium]MCB9502458.1 nucleotidyltransferase domain-containing protein [Deferribacteres bacterium]